MITFPIAHFGNHQAEPEREEYFVSTNKIEIEAPGNPPILETVEYYVLTNDTGTLAE
jgi:hypothetical protein